MTFDPTAFTAAFPRFANPPPSISAEDWPAVLTQNFALACLQLNNTCCGLVRDAPTRATLLNLLVAHITQLLNGIDGLPPSDVAGRISSATQGSVNVQSEMDTQTWTEGYYAQTQYGLTYWTSTARFRTARYVSAGRSSYVGGGADGWDSWPQ